MSRHLDGDGRLDLVGKFGQDFALESSEHERAYERLKMFGGVFVSSDDIEFESLPETHVGPRNPGHQEIEDAPDSLSRFSIGVPVSAKRRWAFTRLTARAVSVPWFLMYCASSSTWQ